MISFSHVYKTYAGPTHALRDVNLEINKGEFIFLTGPSGAGKSTLFKMISAFDRPSSGQVSVAGYDIGRITTGEVPLFRRKIGVIFQDFRLLRGRSVFENVALPLEIRGERQTTIDRRVEEMLDNVGLTYKRSNAVEQLSGGEQQRVAIARALIHQPGVLIADEPTGNLDPQMSEEIMDLLERANAQGTTVFVATHDHELVKRRAKRILGIRAGQISVDQ
ncbi:MAG: cell division ATP-binding protein FtsE [Bdellovibrionota bacterium]